MTTTTKTQTPALPMPGELLGTDTVIASCWQNDTSEDGQISATVLLLQPAAPFYLVVELIEHEGTWWQSVATSYPNIIPAAEAYSEAIGGY